MKNSNRRIKFVQRRGALPLFFLFILALPKTVFSSDMVLKNIDFNTFTQNNEECISLKSDQAHVSSLGGMVSFKKHQVIFKNESKTIEGDFGYIDLKRQILVSRKKNQNVQSQEKEVLLFLRDMSSQEF